MNRRRQPKQTAGGRRQRRQLAIEGSSNDNDEPNNDDDYDDDYDDDDDDDYDDEYDDDDDEDNDEGGDSSSISNVPTDNPILRLPGGIVDNQQQRATQPSTSTTTKKSNGKRKTTRKAKGNKNDEDDVDEGGGRDKKAEAYLKEARSWPDELESFMSPASSLMSKNKRTRKHTVIGELPPWYVQRLTDYLSTLFGSVVLEGIHTKLTNLHDTWLYIPAVVCAILDYNNVNFLAVQYVPTKCQIAEPVWYKIDVATNTLTLYINVHMFHQFCLELEQKPVVMMDGEVALHDYNPHAIPNIASCPNAFRIDQAMINIAVLSDHVALHILNELYADPNKPESYRDDLHENYQPTDGITTLHSMFDITMTCADRPQYECNNYMNFNAPSTSVLHTPYLSNIYNPATSGGLISNTLGGAVGGVHSNQSNYNRQVEAIQQNMFGQ